MTDFYSALSAAEQRPPTERYQALFQALPPQIQHAQRTSAAFGEILKEVNALAVTSPDALAQLPVTRKTDLLERQKTARALAGSTDMFGGFCSIAFGAAMPRVFASPGTIYEPEGKATDYWRMARALSAAGFRAGDLIHNCFSYHFTPAGAMMESGAHALGCTVFPAGTGQTEQQVQAMAEMKP